VFYSAEDCNLFRDCWDVPGRQSSPYIIHPADPSYNITAHSLFTDWGALADAAGELHAALMAALQEGSVATEQMQGRAGCPGSSSRSRDSAMAAGSSSRRGGSGSNEGGSSGIRMRSIGGSSGAAMSSGGGEGSSSTDAWQQVLTSTTLVAAVMEFNSTVD
jgi:hypothetical protein